MNESERSNNYFSYLLRLQRVEDGDRPVWRCSLEIPGTGEVLSFPDLAALASYLEGRTRPLGSGNFGVSHRL